MRTKDPDDFPFLLGGVCARYNIYELKENNGAMQWDYLSNFKWLKSFRQSLTFPQIISPMKNGKFIFYSQFYDRDYSAILDYYDYYIMEVWDIKQNFTQSRLEFPIDPIFSKLRIFQL